MFHSINSLDNNLFVNKAKVPAGSSLDIAVGSKYLLNKQVSSEKISALLNDDTVNISTGAQELLELDQQGKTNENSLAGEEQANVIDKLIESTKEKIDKAKRELDEVVGNTESDKQQRKALQSQLMLLHNQLLLLINQKAELLVKK